MKRNEILGLAFDTDEQPVNPPRVVLKKDVQKKIIVEIAQKGRDTVALTCREGADNILMPIFEKYK